MILRHFQVTCESRLQPKRVQTHVIPHVHDKITIDRYARALLFNRFQIFIEHNFITGDANRAFRHFVNHDARPRYVNTAVRVKRLGVASKTTSGDTSGRTIGGTVIRTLLPLAAIRARQLSSWLQSASPLRLICPCCVSTEPLRVELWPLKFIVSWLGCISNGIKLPSMSTPFNRIWPNSCGLCASPPDAGWR